MPLQNISFKYGRPENGFLIRGNPNLKEYAGLINQLLFFSILYLYKVSDNIIKRIKTKYLFDLLNFINNI